MVGLLLMKLYSPACKDSEDCAKAKIDDTKGTWHNRKERNGKGLEAEVGKEEAS